ncbi:hypothetical protein D3C72_1920390 [compost metagenome]
MQAAEELLDQVGAFDQVAHEDEQRDRDQHVIGHDGIGPLHHQVQRLLHRDLGIGVAIGQP